MCFCDLIGSPYLLPRNPIIARIFRFVKFSESIGSGFDKMIKGWKIYYKSTPIIEGDFDHYKINFTFNDSTNKTMNKTTNKTTNKNEDGTIEHKEFLFETGTNPTKPFGEDLRKTLGDKGSIVVYNQSFEEGRLKELARDYPEFEEWVNQIRARLVDLLIPFRDFAHYDPSQKGSASIKKVLSTLTNLDYSQLEVANGSTAMKELAKIADIDNPEMRKHLLKYCKRDTLAEVETMKALRNIY